MTNASTEVINNLNEMAAQRFQLEVEKQAVTQLFKDQEAELKRDRDALLSAIQAKIETLDVVLYGTVETHRSSLIAKGKQSFATLAAVFQFRKSAATDKVTDADGVMKIARKLGEVRQIAKPIREYRLDRRKFAEWLGKHPELRSHFEDYLETGGGESLSIAPNSGYVVYHDKERISPPSITIKKS